MNGYNNLSSNKKRIYSGNLRRATLKRKGATDNKKLSKKVLDFGNSKHPSQVQD